ncbi:MAG: HAMP domain-containing histidine kinase [Myxococcales bacterium]|nr:HAMP domain-containing histidine kinase [Myxococcales bacterium]
MRRRRPRRLFWRVYLHGVMLLLIVSASVTGVAVLLHDGPPWQQAKARFVELMAMTADGTPAEVQQRLDLLSESLHLNLAAFDADGRVRAESGPRPPAALTTDEPRVPQSGAVDFHRRSALIFAAPTRDGGYLLLATENGGTGRLIGSVAVVLLALALLTVPLTRLVIRPLERLTATARALGQGDLAARTGLRRHDEVGELARAMDEMATRLQGMVLRERELLADISHELRTPLARIRVALELQAEDGGLGPYLEGIDDDLGELEGLIEDVLTSARLDRQAGGAGFTLQRAALDPAALADAAQTRLARRHPSRTLLIQLADDLPEVQGDATFIRRVIDNLLDNAARYGDAEAPIELGFGRDGPDLSVEVSDRGPGLSEADRAQVFEPFYRAERSRARHAGGVGLGLTLCRRIIDAHGGHIAALSRPGGGTTMRFTLPGSA